MFSGVVSCIRLQQPAVITGDYVVIAAGRETYQLIRMEMWREKSNGGPSLYISGFLCISYISLASQQELMGEWGWHITSCNSQPFAGCNSQPNKILCVVLLCPTNLSQSGTRPAPYFHDSHECFAYAALNSCGYCCFCGIEFLVCLAATAKTVVLCCAAAVLCCVIDARRAVPGQPQTPQTPQTPRQ